MGLDPVTLGIASSVVTGIFGGGAARRAKRKAAREAKRLKAKLNFLENNRQEIKNPFRDITSVAGMATDRSTQMSNAYNNLSVATQAAEMQIEQADISLANTLDTLRATGSGAGGATALAQAALQSKKEVSANIEQQEAQNQKLRVQGKQTLQRQQMSEQQRLQQADVSGKQFVFGQQDPYEFGSEYEMEEGGQVPQQQQLMALLALAQMQQQDQTAYSGTALEEEKQQSTIADMFASQGKSLDGNNTQSLSQMLGR